MNDATPVLRSRSAPATATPTREAHDVQMARAAAIARATDMVPKGYRNNPGAVLLAMVWSDAHAIDLVTTMQSVSFINGKPFVSAEMQTAMAKRAGYRLRTETVTDEQATVALYEGDDVLGRETVTMADATRAGWAERGGNWAKTPRNMLLARARTNVIRFYAPDVLLGLSTEDELDDGDPVATLSAADLEPVEDVPADVVEAEVVEPDPDTEALREEVTGLRRQMTTAQKQRVGVWCTRHDVKLASADAEQLEELKTECLAVLNADTGATEEAQ